MSTAPDIVYSFVPPEECDLHDVMIVMDEAFDPEFGEAWSMAQCRGLLLQRGVWIDLLMCGDSPAGFALSRVVADEAELLLLGVRPKMRGNRLGRMLLKQVCDTAKNHGAVKVHLEMREGNSAEFLYRNFGFYQIGRRKRYYRGKSGHKFDAITWSYNLSP